jgi:hypothetical protein
VVPPLDELTLEMIARVERDLATGLKGQQFGAAVVGRFRKVAHAALLRAVDLGILESDPWSSPPRGRRTRKPVSPGAAVAAL